MGSGKSWMICMLSAYKMMKNNLLRTVICVPQTIIASGFTNAKLRMPNNECVHWNIHHNLCKKGSNKSTVKYIIEWLKNDYKTFDDSSTLYIFQHPLEIVLPQISKQNA